MRQWFRRHGRRCKPVAEHTGVLSQCAAGNRVVITGNAELASVELGLYTGAAVEILHNDAGNQMLVVQVGDARLSVPRKWADAIYVESLQCRRGHGGPRHVLREIRAYLREQGKVDTRSLAIHFGMQEEAMDGVLTQLERRGVVRRGVLQNCASGCGGCRGCDGLRSTPPVLWSVVEGEGEA